MTSKRKAEIQRKLTLHAVPRPPADLLDRIKSDIPAYLSVEAERERFSRSVGFNLRVAASILVLISVAAALFMLVPERAPNAITAVSMQRAKEASPAIAKTNAAPATTDELRVDIVQAAPASAAPAQIADAGPPPPAMRRAPVVANEAGRSRDLEEREGVPGGVEGGVVGGVAGGVIGTGVAEEKVDATASAPPMAVPAPPPALEAPAPVAAAGSTRAMSIVRNTPAIVPQAFGDELMLAPTSVFGISVDPAVFRRIKTTIENGGRPSPTPVDVEALVNYFAGAPARRVRHGVRLEAEASPAPVDANGHRGILRLTVDTAGIDVPPRGSVPPIATDARLEIDFNRDAVEHFEAIGDSQMLVPESALLHNVSVTGLYALDLRTPLKAKQRVATITLSYRSVADGKKRTIVRELHGSDFAKKWTSATRRHRLASLGALWGESLRGSHGGTDVARRAEELASQAPEDARARELAAVAVASSGGGTQ